MTLELICQTLDRKHGADFVLSSSGGDESQMSGRLGLEPINFGEHPDN